LQRNGSGARRIDEVHKCLTRLLAVQSSPQVLDRLFGGGTIRVRGWYTTLRVRNGAPMRSIRILLGTVGLFALLGSASACGQPRATNGSGVWIEVNPETVDAGSFVALRAACGDNSVPATVTSKAFGTVSVQPLGNLLTAEAEVPARTKQGGYDVNLACRSGSTATASLRVVGSKGPTAEPSMGPHTGGGFLANRGRSGLTGPEIWLIGGAGALIAAGALGATTVRRRRHRPAR
jgi:hypothetical protein